MEKQNEVQKETGTYKDEEVKRRIIKNYLNY